jgi:hypothetical protein
LNLHRAAPGELIMHHLAPFVYSSCKT